jgi:hypothetical protein
MIIRFTASPFRELSRCEVPRHVVFKGRDASGSDVKGTKRLEIPRE